MLDEGSWISGRMDEQCTCNDVGSELLVTMRGLVHGCKIVIMNKQAGSNR